MCIGNKIFFSYFFKENVCAKAHTTLLKTHNVLIGQRERISGGLLLERGKQKLQYCCLDLIILLLYFKTNIEKHRMPTVNLLSSLDQSRRVTRGDPDQSVQYTVVTNSRYSQITINTLEYILNQIAVPCKLSHEYMTEKEEETYA